MNCLASWPEPVVRVQHLLDSGIRVIPDRYVKKPLERPGSVEPAASEVNIPVIDMKDLHSEDASLRRRTALIIDGACREWGFFQVINHGIRHELMARTREVWYQFFHLPLEEKQKYANLPSTYEGYGSRLGVEKGTSLDWSDYFFLHYLPVGLRDQNKWPSQPVSCRSKHYIGIRAFRLVSLLPTSFTVTVPHLLTLSSVVRLSPRVAWRCCEWLKNFSRVFVAPRALVSGLSKHYSYKCHFRWELVDEYSREVVKLGGNLMKVFSTNLGLREGYLQDAFGGDGEIGACLRTNYYPKCPQPDLTLGLSPHSDPGVMTLLFPDENVSGLQVRHAGEWVTVKPLPNAFIVNLADQLQIMSNGNYKSVEHRVIVNANKERVSLAYFYNPRGDIVIKPAEPLVSKDHPSLYPAMTFDEYRLYIRTKGLHGKSQVESLVNSDSLSHLNS